MVGIKNWPASAPTLDRPHSQQDLDSRSSKARAQQVDAEAAELLRVLLDTFGEDRFDEINISVEAPYRPRLLAALHFLGPGITRRRGARSLTLSCQDRVARWLRNVADREIDGLVVRRDGIGWSEVHKVAR